METYGQFGPIVVYPRKQVTGTFTLNKIQNLDKSERQCSSDSSYSYRDCLMEFAKKKSNCSIDVFKNNFNCSSFGLDVFIGTLMRLRGSTTTEKDIVFETGCLPKCHTHKYKFHLKDETDVTWRRDWVSSFYLSTDTTVHLMSTENYSYDTQVRLTS